MCCPCVSIEIHFQMTLDWIIFLWFLRPVPGPYDVSPACLQRELRWEHLSLLVTSVKWVFDRFYYGPVAVPFFYTGSRWGQDFVRAVVFFSFKDAQLTMQERWSLLETHSKWSASLMHNGDAAFFLNKRILSHEAEMSATTQTGSAKPPKHAEIECESGARVTDKRNWVLCRACLNTQHSQTKGKRQALTGYFQAIIISHKSQTTPDQSLWQHDWWVAVMNVKRNGLRHLISPFSHCERDLGVFMEKSHGCCDEHYPVIMKGTLLYCQPPQMGR